jgi:acetolactate synthase-1/2/3 large subunit
MAEYTVSPLPLPVASEVTGNLATGLALLRECLPPAGEWNYADWARRGEQLKTRSRSLLTQAWQTRGAHGLAPHRVVEIAREVFPRTTIVSVDSGAHALPVATFWEAYAPKEYLCSGEFGGAGYALPAGIAASIRQTSSPVVAFMGESGFLMNLAEVATASRLGCPLVVVLFVDESLSLVRVAQEQRRYAPLGVSLGALDMPKIAEGLGALGTCVGDEEGLRSALQDAVGTTKPAIVAARVNPHGYRKMYDLLRGKTP